jgi:uncharacterized membrane protein YphA (DoxX/SURF4 family)
MNSHKKGLLLKSILAKIRKTRWNKPLGVIRLVIGLIILSTGVMKLLVPMLWIAWSGQLTQSNIPLYTFNLWFVPIVEMVTGLLLITGLYSRLAAIVVIIMMMVATYVHIVIDDPSLFPLQPKQPIIPLILIIMCIYILWRGGGSWSQDLKIGN